MPIVPLFDEAFARLGAAPLSFTEGDALATLWGQGEDAWLREDERFRPTPWGRWVAANRYLVNDIVVAELGLKETRSVNLSRQLEVVGGLVGAPTAFCPADPRLVYDAERGTVRLAPITDVGEEVLEDAPPLLQFVSHLPFYDLSAVAASEPAGEWGLSAEPKGVESLGWIEVPATRRPLHRAEFVARVQGRSMDGGKSPIRDGERVIFRFAYREGTAYDSGKGKPVVLVRGGFTDPELGSYALKRWARAATAITLESTNPDRDVYPDIVVPPDRAHDVRIIAEWARPFEAVAERPPRLGKGPRSPGAVDTPAPDRDLDDDALTARALPTSAEAEAEPAGEGPEPSEPPNEATQPPSMVWICLPPEEGGPHLEFGHFESLLRPAITRLRFLDDRGGEFVALAANVRGRSTSVPVAPGSGPWRCEPIGLEVHAERLGFGGLACSPLPNDRVSIFPTDAEGIGRRVERRAVRMGEPCHLIVPPGIAPSVVGHPLGAGWRQLPICPGETHTAFLRTLGVSLERSAPALLWAGLSPRRWVTGAGGPIAVFAPGDTPILAIDGLPEAIADGCLLVLCQPGTVERVVLPVGRSAIVRLPPLGMGRWGVMVTHRRADVPESRVTFEVEAPTPCVVQAAVSISGLSGPPGSPPLDLSDQSLWVTPPCITAPPGWRVEARWHGHGHPWHGRSAAGRDGVVAGLLDPKMIRRAAEACAVGVLEVDFGELGRFVLRHRRARDPERFARWYSTQAPHAVRLKATRPNDWHLLLTRWVEPLLGALGYTIAATRSPSPEGAPADVTVFTAQVGDVSVVGGRSAVIRRTTAAVSVVNDVEATIQDHGDWLESVMRELSVEAIFVTDGLRWCRRRRGAWTRATVHDLSNTPSPEQLEVFLDTFAGAY